MLRSDTDMRYFVARLSAQEVQKTERQSEQLHLLNYIVFVLGLISALASVLAIQERSKYTIPFIVAAVLAIVAIIVAKSFDHIRAGAKRVRQLLISRAGDLDLKEDPTPVPRDDKSAQTG